MSNLATLVQAAFYEPDTARREAAEGELLSFREQRTADYVKALVPVIQSAEVPLPIRRGAIILCWQIFPEDLPEEDLPHPFDVVGEECVSGLFALSSHLISGVPELAGFAGNLLGRIASLMLHRNTEHPIVGQLTQGIVTATSAEAVIGLATAIENICVAALSEEDEIGIVLQAVFQVLNKSPTAEIAAKMADLLTAVIESREEVLADPSVLGGMMTVVMTLSTQAATIGSAMKCWVAIGSTNSLMLTPVAGQLVTIVLNVLAIDDTPAEVLCNACEVVSILYDNDVFNNAQYVNEAVVANSNNAVQGLLKVIANVLSDECDMKESWEPHLAAHKALFQLAIVMQDSVLVQFGGNAMEMIRNEAFGTRYAGLCLLYCVIICAENPMIMMQFVPGVLSVARDGAARVRHMALKCLKEVFERGTREDASAEAKAQMLPLSASAMPAMELLRDTPIVARAAANVMAAATGVPGFPGTEHVLKTLIEQAIALGSSRINNPFAAVAKVVDNADESILLQSFPVFVGLLGRSAEPGMAWLIHALSEVFDGFLIRFGERLCPHADELAKILLVIASGSTDFSNDALITLGLCVQRIPSHGQIVPQVLACCKKALEFGQDIYPATKCLEFVAYAGDIGDDSLVIINVLLGFVTDIDRCTAPKDKRGAIDAIVALAACNLARFAPVADNVISRIRTFTMVIDFIWAEEDEEGQLTATAVGNCMLQVLTAKPDLFERVPVVAWLETVVAHEDIMERLTISALRLILFITQTDKNHMLIIIEKHGEIGEFLVTQQAASQQAISEISAQILTLLGYE